MKNILKKLTLRPVLICVVSFLIMAAGILATANMNTNLLPDMNMPIVGITVIYPGANATSVEDEVTTKLESSIKTINGINTVTSYSIDNAGMLVINFNYGTQLDKKVNEIKDILDKLDLPANSQEPTITTIDFNKMAAATLSIFNDDGEIDQLIDKANQLKDSFYNIEGVGQVDILGIPEKEINLKSLDGLDITILTVLNSLSSLNYDIPLGTIISGNSIAITNQSNPTSIDELKALPIKLSLPTNTFNQLNDFNNQLNTIQNSTVEELNNQINDGTKAHLFINDLNNKTPSEINTTQENLDILKSIMDLIRDNTIEELNALGTKLNNLKTDSTFKSANEEGLKPYSEDTGLSISLLKLIQLMIVFNRFDDVWNGITSFKQTHPNPVSYSDFANLFINLGLFTNSESLPDDVFLAQCAEKCQLADFVDNKILLSISKKKENNEVITLDDYCLLFNNLITPNMMNLIVQEDYDTKAQTLIQFKEDHKLNNETNPISNEDFKDLIEILGLDNSLPFTITCDILNLVRTIDYETLVENDGTSSTSVSLGSLCHVNMISESSDYSQFNDLQSLQIKVYTSNEANTSKVVKNVKKIIGTDEYNNVILLDDQAKFIDDSINSVISSMIIGGVLAIIVIFLFIRKIRTSLVIAITMPLSVLTALLCMWAQGISLNMVSLGGLAVGIGMLVDNSIVVIESITKYRDNGATVYEAAVDGTSEVAGSLLASTLTTICVFFPILFTEGLTKEIFGDLTYAVIYSIVFSLVVAITVIPTLYCLVYRKSINSQSEIKTTSKISKIEEKYAQILRKLLKRKGLVCLCALLVFLISTILVFTSGIEFLPSIDKGQIEVNIHYDVSTTLDEARSFTDQSVNTIKDNVSNIDQIAYSIGVNGLMSTNLSTVISIQLDNNHKKTNDVCQDIRQALKNDQFQITVTEIDGVLATLTSGMNGISVTLLSNNMEDLYNAVNEIETKLININGIYGVRDNATEKTTEYAIHIDQNKCIENSLDYSNVVMLLRVGLSSYNVGTIKIDGEDNYNVVLEFNDNTKSSIDNINNVIVGFSDDAILLKDIATVTESEKTSIVTKTDNLNAVVISLETYNVDTGSVTKDINKVVDEVLSNYNTVTSKSSGVSSYLNDAFSGLVVALIAAFVLLYGVMACQFESFVKPFIVIASIPLAFTGGFLALWISNFNLDVVSFIGLIMLMGVVVNDAIVMIDKIDLLRKENPSTSECDNTLECVVQGATTRLRAIWMTSLTTILALVPIAFSFGKGGELLQPMGIVVIGGLLLATVVTLVLIPCFYCLVKRVKTK